MRIDRTRKLPVTVLLRALGFGSDQEITELLGDNEYLSNTLEKTTQIAQKKHCLKFMSVYVLVNHQQ